MEYLIYCLFLFLFGCAYILFNHKLHSDADPKGPRRDLFSGDECGAKPSSCGTRSVPKGGENNDSLLHKQCQFIESADPSLDPYDPSFDYDYSSTNDSNLSDPDDQSLVDPDDQSLADSDNQSLADSDNQSLVDSDNQSLVDSSIGGDSIASSSLGGDNLSMIELYIKNIKDEMEIYKNYIRLLENELENEEKTYDDLLEANKLIMERSAPEVERSPLPIEVNNTISTISGSLEYQPIGPHGTGSFSFDPIEAGNFTVDPARAGSKADCSSGEQSDKQPDENIKPRSEDLVEDIYELEINNVRNVKAAPGNKYWFSSFV